MAWLRNDAAHGHYDEHDEPQVEALVRDARDFLLRYLAREARRLRLVGPLASVETSAVGERRHAFRASIARQKQPRLPPAALRLPWVERATVLEGHYAHLVRDAEETARAKLDTYAVADEAVSRV
jgi:hypothetical protein